MNRKALINLFLNNPGKSFSVDEIMGLTRLFSEEAVRVQIFRLREKGLPIVLCDFGYTYKEYGV